MSEHLTAAQRFEDLFAKYRSLVPARKVSRARRRELRWAASLEQVREAATLERALGRPHDRLQLEQMRVDAQAHLRAGGVRLDQVRK